MSQRRSLLRDKKKWFSVNKTSGIALTAHVSILSAVGQDTMKLSVSNVVRETKSYSKRSWPLLRQSMAWITSSGSASCVSGRQVSSSVTVWSVVRRMQTREPVIGASLVRDSFTSKASSIVSVASRGAPSVGSFEPSSWISFAWNARLTSLRSKMPILTFLANRSNQKTALCHFSRKMWRSFVLKSTKYQIKNVLHHSSKPRKSMIGRKSCAKSKPKSLTKIGIKSKVATSNDGTI